MSGCFLDFLATATHAPAWAIKPEAKMAWLEMDMPASPLRGYGWIMVARRTRCQHRDSKPIWLHRCLRPKPHRNLWARSCTRDLINPASTRHRPPPAHHRDPSGLLYAPQPRPQSGNARLHSQSRHRTWSDPPPLATALQLKMYVALPLSTWLMPCSGQTCRWPTSTTEFGLLLLMARCEIHGLSPLAN